MPCLSTSAWREAFSPLYRISRQRTQVDDWVQKTKKIISWVLLERILSFTYIVIKYHQKVMTFFYKADGYGSGGGVSHPVIGGPAAWQSILKQEPPYWTPNCSCWDGGYLAWHTLTCKCMNVYERVLEWVTVTSVWVLWVVSSLSKSIYHPMCNAIK